MTKIKSICLYCGSSSSTRESHRNAAREFGTLIAREKITLVFGGGRAGLMGLAADAALEAGGNVIGVIPEFLVEREVGHHACTKLFTTKTMHDRKQKMAELSDAFAILPGGLGTLDETFEIVTWRQLGLHEKPIVLVNIDKYWDPLLILLKQMAHENYIPQREDEFYSVVSSIQDILPTVQLMPPAQMKLINI
ncbi:MAG: TIGR00730 family Rossman fold protein [Pseudomonadota bacterium]|nr:TIGR00730 family Rossman fold protein [Pseudomonadota bacterium]